jgi:hypothetical protein
MNKFIKLTNIVINSSHITKINIKDNKYFIEFNKYDFDGFIILTYGQIKTENYILEICKKNNINDFLTISSWIEKFTFKL